jgi:hypothetical protein
MIEFLASEIFPCVGSWIGWIENYNANISKAIGDPGVTSH